MGDLRRCVWLRDMSGKVLLNGQINHRIAMIFQDCNLSVSKRIEVDSDLRDHVTNEVVWIDGDVGCSLVAARQTAHAPVCALHVTSDHRRDQPALSEFSDLLEERDDMS